MEPAFLQTLRGLAGHLDRIDVPVYEAYGKDPLEPIVGGGDRRCRVAVMGRDPGRHEVEHGMPFIGAGGQKVRRGLHEALTGKPMPDFEASVWAGEHVFWANTVPYKPIGNKVWPAKVRKAFTPHITDLLVHGWDGCDVLTLGRVAFFWFAHTKELKKQLTEAWATGDVFETVVPVTLTATDGTHKTFRLRALPHPSPLNATWAPHFPRLLAQRLQQVGFGADTWRL